MEFPGYAQYVCIRKINILAYPKNLDFNIGDHVEMYEKYDPFSEHKSELIYFENVLHLVDVECFRNNFIHIDIWRRRQLDQILS
jgi:hypothetical protein